MFLTATATTVAEIEFAGKTTTYEVVFKVWMHVIDAVVHDSRCDALSRVTQRPSRFHVQI